MKSNLMPIIATIAVMTVTCVAHANLPTVQSQSFQPQVASAHTADSQKLRAIITAYADAQCKGKNVDELEECKLKSLWAATQGDPDTLERQARPEGDGGVGCVVPKGGFAFDVVSIKFHEPRAGERRTSQTVGVTLDGYRSLNAPILYLIINAYNTAGLKPIDITGGPRWITEDRYDFEGKYTPEVADAINRLGRDDSTFVLGCLLRRVLKERMNFATHIDMKETAAFDLIVGKNGPKLHDADLTAKDTGDTVVRADPEKRGMILATLKGARMAVLARTISRPAGRPVFDKTGLTGMYDIVLSYQLEQPQSMQSGANTAGNTLIAPLDSGAPTIFNAIEALGLKLVPSREPMMSVVVEHIDKPSAN
jgi:uncharacterized protein (TIGR03435 family)